jgi:prolipoprotein diacylglyceryltransferase
LARLTVEFWRLNPSLALGLSEAQWFGLAMIIVGLWQLLRGGRVKTAVAT